MPPITSSGITPSLQSRSREEWPCRSNISIFVKCLHLLDLDLLDDWPQVTERSLSIRSADQSLQQRVRSVEWCLFKLFELYSPDVANEVGSEDILPDIDY
jgi:HAUS augmin-like complex subunit 6 N-terminus